MDVAISNDFANCSCDLTFGACDSNCCCDPDCSADLITMWSLDRAANCKDYEQRKSIQSLAECRAEIQKPHLEDLEIGLLYFGK